MAITSTPGTGIVVESSAKNGTLTSGSTTGAVLDTDINTNNGNLEVGAVLAGRLIYLSGGTGAGQIRYITADNGTTGITVNDPWDTTPDNTTTYEISYILNDCATVTGLTYQTKADFYSSGRRLTVGNATDFAFLGLLDGSFLESVDQSSTTVADFTIENNGMFQSGYLENGKPISGGYYIATPAVDGELAYDAKTGSTVYLYDYQSRAVRVPSWEQDGGTHVWKRTKLFKPTYQMLLHGTMDISDSTIEGTSATTDTITIDTTFTTDVLSVINMNGFTTATTGTFTLKNVLWINPLLIINAPTGTTWNAVNPIGWDIINPANQDNLAITGTGSVNWKYSLDITTQEPSGTPIGSSRIFLYEGVQTDSLVLDLTANGTTGVVSDTWVYKNYVDGGATNLTETTYGNHALRVYKYGKTPFIAAISSDALYDSVITLTVDPSITEATQATALTNGSGITVTKHGTGETDTRPMKVFYYDGGTGGTPTLGATVTSGTATGTVVEYLGDAVSGTLVVESWNGVEFTDNTTITDTGTFSATTDTAGFYQEYTWEVDANTLSMNVLYDYLAAKMAEGTLDATFTKVHIWGQDQQAQLLYSGTSGYYTPRNTTLAEGVWVHNRGGGSIAYFTSDGGTTYTPPASYTHTLTGLVAGSEVTYVDDADNPTITYFHVESSGTSTGYSYVYSGSPITVDILVFNITYEPILIEGVSLGASDATVPISQDLDGNYYNPA